MTRPRRQKRYTLLERFEKRYAKCKTQESKRKCLFDLRKEIKEALDAMNYFVNREEEPSLSKEQALEMLERLLIKKEKGSKESPLEISEKSFGHACLLLAWLLNAVGTQIENRYAQKLFKLYEVPLNSLLHDYYSDVFKRSLSKDFGKRYPHE